MHHIRGKEGAWIDGSVPFDVHAARSLNLRHAPHTNVLITDRKSLRSSHACDILRSAHAHDGLDGDRGAAHLVKVAYVLAAEVAAHPRIQRAKDIIEITRSRILPLLAHERDWMCVLLSACTRVGGAHAYVGAYGRTAVLRWMVSWRMRSQRSRSPTLKAFSSISSPSGCASQQQWVMCYALCISKSLTCSKRVQSKWKTQFLLPPPLDCTCSQRDPRSQQTCQSCCS